MEQLKGNTPRVPWHLWAMGILGLLWNSFGGYDYIMTRFRDMDYLDMASGGHGKVILDWIDRMPMLAQVLWPLGVWMSVLGSILLLMRSRHAVGAFALSLIGAAGSFAMQFASSIPPEVDTPAAKIMPLVILALIVWQWRYAHRQRAAGLLV